MPTISDSVTGHHEAVVTGIYVARGDETLGPYDSLEAAALVASGFLRVNDHAARNGDAAWLPLSEFLPPSAPVLNAAPAPVREPDAPPTTMHQNRRRIAEVSGVLFAISLIVTVGMRWFGHHHDGGHSPVVQAPLIVPTNTGAAPMTAADVLPAQSAPAVDGPVHGSLSSAVSDGKSLPLAGVRVSIYPLAAVEASLAPVIAEAQTVRARLDPQIETAATERANRAAEAWDALQALHDADPSDPLIASLRFANTGAKAAAKTADNDYRYLLDERTAAAGGEVFFRSLPEPILTADTDARGNFALSLPPGEGPYVLAASSRQTTDDGAAHPRYWLVKLSPAQRSGREVARLDDGNVSSSPAAESLIHTAD